MKSMNMAVVVGVFLLLFLFGALQAQPVPAPKSLILGYSNNISAEIDPCPT